MSRILLNVVPLTLKCKIDGENRLRKKGHQQAAVRRNHAAAAGAVSEASRSIAKGLSCLQPRGGPTRTRRHA